MRHSTTHLALAFCTTMAVSSTPLSPNPLSSQALVTPRMIPEGEAFDLRHNDRDGSTPQKRSVGGITYHNSDNNELDKRATDKPIQSKENEQMNSFSQSDFKALSNSDFELESDYDADVGSTSDSEYQPRSIHEVQTRSTAPSALEERAGVDNVNGASDFDDNASTASADDENMSVMSDDDSSVTSAESFPDAGSASTASDVGEVDRKSSVGGQEKPKLNARNFDINSQLSRHGGRKYVDVNSWTV